MNDRARLAADILLAFIKKPSVNDSHLSYLVLKAVEAADSLLEKTKDACEEESRA